MSTQHEATAPSESALARMKRHIDDRIRRRRRRWMGLGITSGLVLAGAATTAGIMVVNVPPEISGTASFCYEEPSTTSLEHVVQEVDPDPTRPAVQAARERCELLWSISPMGREQFETVKGDGSSQFPVPDLVVCLRPDQVTAVFPASEDPNLCRRLGLIPLE